MKTYRGLVLVLFFLTLGKTEPDLREITNSMLPRLKGLAESRLTTTLLKNLAPAKGARHTFWLTKE